MKASVDSKSMIPASEPRPDATSEPQALPSCAAFVTDM